MRTLTTIGIAILVIGGGILLYRHSEGSVGGFSNEQFGSLVALVALLIVIGGGMLSDAARPRGIARSLMSVAIWAVFAAGLVGLYAYRDELAIVGNRMVREIVPATPEIVSGGKIALQRAFDDHFYIDATANEANIRFLVDTGASVTTITEQDAKAAGLDAEALQYAVPVSTANGMTLMARARLDRVVLGNNQLNDVSILVAPAGALQTSLLGNNVLKTFSSVAFAGDRLVLTP